MKAKKYEMTSCNVFNETYRYSEDENAEICSHSSIETWKSDSSQTVLDWLKDTLDVVLTEKKLTLAQIHEDFDSPRENGALSDKDARKILAYYNGRLALYKKIVKEFKSAIAANAKKTTLKYDIPEKINSFSLDNYNGKFSQEEAYIEIKIR